MYPVAELSFHQAHGNVGNIPFEVAITRGLNPTIKSIRRRIFRPELILPYDVVLTILLIYRTPFNTCARCSEDAGYMYVTMPAPETF
jgi:hypothetical protein